MAAPRSVWAIDIGQCTFKALKLCIADGELRVEAFDIIEHPKILSQPDAEKQLLVRSALEQFLSRNSVSDSVVVVSVPGQSSFTRFVKLPPVEPRKIPDIVRFEAEQQIPFPIADVIWRWQRFQDPDSPDVEVGIFAMKRVDVAEVLDHFVAAGLNVDIVQMAPLALYNFMSFDGQLAKDGATLLVDVGASKTDLVVADAARIWTRTIQVGGNDFTEALMRAFKLSFSKAEKLKRTAATSKYARQVFQAMKPVFVNLVQEVQRSVGYYTSLHRDARFKRLIGLGNGFRLPGLQKFLEQNLDIPVVRIDSYNNLGPSPAVNAPMFAENVPSLAVTYGLGLQGLEQTRINTNLLPSEISSRRRWSKKRPWFAAAAAILLAAIAGPLYRAGVDRSVLAPSADFRQTRDTVEDLSRLRNEYRGLVNQGRQEQIQVAQYRKLFDYREFWPSVQVMLSQSIQAVARDQVLLSADEESLKKLKDKPRQTRRVIVVEDLQAEYYPDVSNVSLQKGGDLSRGAARGDRGALVFRQSRRGFKITLTGRTPLPKAAANNLLLAPLLRQSESIARRLKGVDVVDFAVIEFLPMSGSARKVSRSRTPVRSAAGYGDPYHGSDPSGMGMPVSRARETERPEETGPRMPDPLLPDEDMSNDTRFVIGWVLAITDSGDTAPSAD